MLQGVFGKAFVELSTQEAAVAVRSGLDGRNFDGRTLVAKFCDKGTIDMAAHL